MLKLGLQLRVKPPPTRPPIPTPLGFNDDDFDDNVERDILRQAYKNKTSKRVEEQHKKTLEQDPWAFDYDGVYDQMKEKQSRPKQMDRQPRYIPGVIDMAKQRHRENDIINERKLAKERNQDEDVYADKDKFVSSAYKKKLAEQAKWLEEERLRQLQEDKEDVTKKTDITDFYYNLAKNVAFGAGDTDKEKPRKQREEVVVSLTATGTSSVSSQIKPASDITAQNQVTTEPSTSNQVKLDNKKENDDATKARHKRSEDAIAVARERFLARKKAKV